MKKRKLEKGELGFIAILGVYGIGHDLLCRFP